MIALQLVAIAVLVGTSSGMEGRWLPARSPRRSARHRADPLDVARIMTVALAAGLGVQESLLLAAARLGGGARSEVDAVLRSARADGMAAALGGHQGRLSGLAADLARALVTGAPLGAALDAFLRRGESEERARRLERARMLPLKMVVPLTLLLLPGFLLVVMGPVIVENLGELTGTVLP